MTAADVVPLHERRESFADWLARRFPRADVARAADQTHPAHVALMTMYVREVALDEPGVEPEHVALSVVATIPAPPRDWIVDGWAHASATVLLSSHGGLGKSLLSAQLAVALAAGVPFLGLAVRRSRVLLLATEDSRDELHFRLAAIADFVGVDLLPLGREGWLRVLDCTGRDFTLFGREATLDGSGRSFVPADAAPTSWHSWLRDKMDEWHTDVLIGDSLSDLFDGDEIRRRDVRRFVRSMSALVMRRRGCAFLVGHIDKASARTGTRGEAYSGSTAWHNSVRQRWEMYRNTDPLDPDAGDDVPSDDGTRVLELVKNNYGPRGAQITLRLDPQRHVLIGAANSTSDNLVTSITRSNERKAVLAAMAEAAARGIPVPASETNRSTAYEALECLPSYPTALRGRAGKARLFRLLRQLRADQAIEAYTFTGAGRHRRDGYRLPEPAA